MYGYTLFEIIISLIVISLLTAWGIPAYENFRLDNLIIQERNRLSASLHTARSHSIIKNEYVVICPSQSNIYCDAENNWHKGWIIFLDKNHNKERSLDEKILHSEDQMREGIKTISSIHRSKIRYNSNGYSPGNNATISFCDKRGSSYGKTLIINNAGRVRQGNQHNINCNQ